MSDTRTRDAPARDAKTKASESNAFKFDDPKDSASLGDLLRRLAEQGAHLASQQVELVKAEVKSSVTEMKEAAGAMAGAAVVGLAGLGVTLMGVAFLLAEALPLWLATMIVGAAAVAVAYAMYAAGQKKLQSKAITAERSRRTLERAPEALSGDSKKADRP